MALSRVIQEISLLFAAVKSSVIPPRTQVYGGAAAVKQIVSGHVTREGGRIVRKTIQQIDIGER